MGETPVTKRDTLQVMGWMNLSKHRKSNSEVSFQVVNFCLVGFGGIQIVASAPPHGEKLDECDEEVPYKRRKLDPQLQCMIAVNQAMSSECPLPEPQDDIVAGDSNISNTSLHALRRAKSKSFGSCDQLHSSNKHDDDSGFSIVSKNADSNCSSSCLLDPNAKLVFDDEFVEIFSAINDLIESGMLDDDSLQLLCE